MKSKKQFKIFTVKEQGQALQSRKSRKFLVNKFI
jgi:hypothetical protein